VAAVKRRGEARLAGLATNGCSGRRARAAAVERAIRELI
jgi:hypothetical protein